MRGADPLGGALWAPGPPGPALRSQNQALATREKPDQGVRRGRGRPPHKRQGKGHWPILAGVPAGEGFPAGGTRWKVPRVPPPRAGLPPHICNSYFVTGPKGLIRAAHLHDRDGNRGAYHRQHQGQEGPSQTAGNAQPDANILPGDVGEEAGYFGLEPTRTGPVTRRATSRTTPMSAWFARNRVARNCRDAPRTGIR